LEELRCDARCSNLRKIPLSTPALLVLRLPRLLSREGIQTDAILAVARVESEFAQLPCLKILEISGDRTEVARVMLVLPDPGQRLVLDSQGRALDRRRQEIDQYLWGRVLSRVVAFMRNASKKNCLASHSLQLVRTERPSHTDIHCVHLDLLHRGVPQPLNTQSVTLNISGVTPVCINDLSSHVKRMEMWSADLSYYRSALSMFNHIPQLSIYGLDLEFSDPYDNDEEFGGPNTRELLESSMSTRAPLEKLELRYYTDQGFLLPSKDDQVAAEGKWKTLEWVQQVEWIFVVSAGDLLNMIRLALINDLGLVRICVLWSLAVLELSTTSQVLGARFDAWTWRLTRID
jgi:hypothetical protein